MVDFTFTDRAGRTAALKDVAGSKGTVVAMTSASCPLSRKWAPAVGEAVKRIAGSGVVFVAVNVNPSDSDEAVSHSQRSPAPKRQRKMAVPSEGHQTALSLSWSDGRDCFADSDEEMADRTVSRAAAPRSLRLVMQRRKKLQTGFHAKPLSFIH